MTRERTRPTSAWKLCSVMRARVSRFRDTTEEQNCSGRHIADHEDERAVEAHVDDGLGAVRGLAPYDDGRSGRGFGALLVEIDERLVDDVVDLGVGQARDAGEVGII